jgi:purine-nucleoside phosphorylase
MNSRLPAFFQLGKYNISPEDVVRCTFGCEPDTIENKVIVTPNWGPDVFADAADAITEIASGLRSVWQLSYAGRVLSLIRSGIGAPMAGEAVLALGCTPCKTLIFTGSLAGLHKDIRIGDLFVVERSICGDGFSRYLNSDILPNDSFLQPVIPARDLTEHVKGQAAEICHSRSLPLHQGTVFSTDSVLTEFFRLNHFLEELKCTGLEMETAAVFRSANLLRIEAAALLVVSDTPLQNKSLFSGRTLEDRERVRANRRGVLARAILDSLVSFE